MRHWWACRISQKKLGCNAQLIVDEFGEKLLEELDYLQEARNIQVQFSALTPIAALVQLLFLYCKPLALAEHTSNYFCITSFQQFSRSERPDLLNINGAILHTKLLFWLLPEHEALLSFGPVRGTCLRGASGHASTSTLLHCAFHNTGMLAMHDPSSFLSGHAGFPQKLQQ